MGSLNREAQDSGSPVRVHCLSPGMVLTDLLLAGATARNKQVCWENASSVGLGTLCFARIARLDRITGRQDWHAMQRLNLLRGKISLHMVPR